MPRLSIDLTDQQHQHLKAAAAISGQSIRDFVLARTFQGIENPGDMTEEDAMRALRDLLDDRMAQARITASADDIKRQARAARG